MYCQSCGAQNATDARFCNMCGAKIAPPGTPGGPVPGAAAEGLGATDPRAELGAAAGPAPLAAGPGHTVRKGMQEAPAPAAQPQPQGVWEQAGMAHDGGAPPPYSMPRTPIGGGPSMASVSLAGIGVTSSRRTWAVIAAIGFGLVLIGGLGMFLIMRSGREPAPVARADPGERSREDHPIEIGTPLPEGREAPNTDFVVGGTGGATSAREVGSPSSMTTSSAGGGASGAGATTMAAATGGSAGTASAMSGGAGTSGGATGGATGGGQAGTSGGAAGAAGSGGGTSGGTSGGTVPDGTVPEERDIAVDMYASRVRYVITRYYASRAQSCFDHQTRNDPDVRGTVVISFTIAVSGQVSRASVSRNTTGNAALGRCLAGQVSTWRLPAPPEGALDLEMPFSN